MLVISKIMDRDWTKLILMVLLRQSRYFARLDIFIKFDGKYIEAVANTMGHISCFFAPCSSRMDILFRYG